MARIFRVQVRILLAAFTVLLALTLTAPQSMAASNALANTGKGSQQAVSAQVRNADCYSYNYKHGNYYYYRYCYHYRYQNNRRYYYKFSLYYYYYQNNRKYYGECSYGYSGYTHPTSPYQRYCSGK